MDAGIITSVYVSLGLIYFFVPILFGVAGRQYLKHKLNQEKEKIIIPKLENKTIEHKVDHVTKSNVTKLSLKEQPKLPTQKSSIQMLPSPDLISSQDVRICEKGEIVARSEKVTALGVSNLTEDHELQTLSHVPRNQNIQITQKYHMLKIMLHNTQPEPPKLGAFKIAVFSIVNSIYANNIPAKYQLDPTYSLITCIVSLIIGTVIDQHLAAYYTSHNPLNPEKILDDIIGANSPLMDASSVYNYG